MNEYTREIDEKLIDWLDENFDESREECKRLILKEEVETPSIAENIIEGIKILKEQTKIKRSLSIYLEMLRELTNRGVYASRAGELMANTYKNFTAINNNNHEGFNTENKG